MMTIIDCETAMKMLLLALLFTCNVNGVAKQMKMTFMNCEEKEMDPDELRDILSRHFEVTQQPCITYWSTSDMIDLVFKGGFSLMTIYTGSQKVVLEITTEEAYDPFLLLEELVYKLKSKIVIDE